MSSPERVGTFLLIHICWLRLLSNLQSRCRRSFKPDMERHHLRRCYVTSQKEMRKSFHNVEIMLSWPYEHKHTHIYLFFPIFYFSHWSSDMYDVEISESAGSTRTIWIHIPARECNHLIVFLSSHYSFGLVDICKYAVTPREEAFRYVQTISHKSGTWSE